MDDNLSNIISQILQVRLERGRWHNKIYGPAGLDAAGAFQKAQTDKMLVAIGEYVEWLEERIKDLEIFVAENFIAIREAKNALRPEDKK